MTDTRRDPRSDNELIDEAEENRTSGQSGTSGGDLQREIGALDEEATATGGDPQPTSVQKSQKPGDGDAPNLPNRQDDRGATKVPPRRT